MKPVVIDIESVNPSGESRVVIKAIERQDSGDHSLGVLTLHQSHLRALLESIERFLKRIGK